MKQKTILQHLNRLPECVRLDVKLEFVRQGVNLDKVTYWTRTSDVIMDYISWFGSELGYYYFWKLYEELLYHEQNNLKLPR